MRVLGYDIDTEFIYKVGPVKMGETTYGYVYFFDLDFKDGRSHRVSITNNYSPFLYRGHEYVDSKPITNRKAASMFKKKKSGDLEKIKSIRDKIILTKK